MAAATAAKHLGALHSVAVVGTQDHASFVDRVPETRPPGAGIKFRVRTEQFLPASRTRIGAGRMIVPVLASKRPLRAGLAEHMVLLRRQDLLPLCRRMRHWQLAPGCRLLCRLCRPTRLHSHNKSD